MRRIGNLYERLLDMELMLLAIAQAAKGKSLKRRKDVAEVLSKREFYASKAISLLRGGLYRPSPPKTKTIHEKYSGKEREIGMIPFFPDAVIQSAMVLLLRPLILKRMDPYSCAHVIGRGQTAVLRRVRSILRKEWAASHPKDGSRPRRNGAKYWLYMDVRHFYQSIDRPTMRAKLLHIVKDVRFVDLAMDCACVSETGIVIGTNLSVWMSSLYLEEADRVAHRAGVRYLVHFADDVVLIGGNRRKLIRAKKEVDAYLASVGLRTKPNWQCRSFGDCPLTMLQYRFMEDGKTMLKKSIWRNARRTFLRYPGNRRHQSVVAYVGMLSHVNHGKAFLEYGLDRMKAIARRAISSSIRAKADGPIREWSGSGFQLNGRKEDDDEIQRQDRGNGRQADQGQEEGTDERE